MKDNINDKKIDSYDDLPKSVKNTHTDDPLDDLISANCDGKGEDVSVYKRSNKTAQKYIEDKLIESVIASAVTLIIFTYCNFFNPFYCLNQCKEMIEKSGQMKDYHNVIKTKNKRANENFKGNNVKFMAKIRDFKKEEWYTFKNKLLKPHIGSSYPELTSLNMFLLENEAEKNSSK